MSNDLPSGVWQAYRWLLSFVVLICLIGALLGRMADLLALLVVGNGLIALQGWIHGVAIGSRRLWRILCWIDAGMLLLYALLLAQAEGGPPVWSLVLVEALLFAPMLHAMHRYSWHSAAIWPDDVGRS
ncbi:MAG: hypothetical protein KDI48_03960 [Xanthomonadales bacterium]|nr:hypothetical protein [Xanthomonadales bacterium]